MKENWFSSKIVFGVLEEGVGSNLFMKSIIIFKAKDFEDAFKKALDLGKEMEQEYLNGENKGVRWRLKEISTLDIILDFQKKQSLDGVEVYSEPHLLKPEESIDSFEVIYNPEKSKPTQTI